MRPVVLRAAARIGVNAIVKGGVEVHVAVKVNVRVNVYVKVNDVLRATAPPLAELTASEVMAGRLWDCCCPFGGQRGAIEKLGEIA